MEITKILYDTPEKRGLFVSGRCYTSSIKKVDKGYQQERVKMTNRIYEQELTPTQVALYGYVKCSKCERVTAWETCAMCR